MTPGNEALTQQASETDAPTPPAIEFDPAADAPALTTFDEKMVNGVRTHLWRYGALEGVRRALSRIEDPAWLEAWSEALRAAAPGARVLFHRSELGLLPALAHTHGAARIGVLETHPLTGRIAEGVVRKNRLIAWHRLHGTDAAALDGAARTASFESFCADLHLVPFETTENDLAEYDCVVFPDLDHTLLGTGIAASLRKLRARGLRAGARVLPGRASIFAMPIEWAQRADGFELEPMNDFRWSFYPQPLDSAGRAWNALGPPTLLGEIDFQAFAETKWNLPLPIHTTGIAGGILFWFEVELGASRFTTVVGSSLQCLKPAVQYIDPRNVQSGDALEIAVAVGESGLRFASIPSPALKRTATLPSWYMPMLFDSVRNEAYQSALHSLQQQKPMHSVLDIGSGCGLLSMMAARAGAQIAYGCESNRAIFQSGERVIDANGMGARIKTFHKDCRQLSIPGDLPERAETAVFELFDASLIGEGVLHILAYARERLLTPKTRYLPMAARIRAMLVEYRLNEALGVDLNLLNPFRHSPGFVNVDARQLRYRALSEPFDVFEFEFATATPAAQHRSIAVPAIADGIAGAILFWFDLRLTEDQWLSNDPSLPTSAHWKQGLQLLPEVTVRSGTSLPLQARHNGSALSFVWEADKLRPADASKLPPFDFMTLRYTMELQAQTGALLQRCQNDPEEFRNVAHLAQRFARDPAAHDLDPEVAQRFATMFMGS